MRKSFVAVAAAIGLAAIAAPASAAITLDTKGVSGTPLVETLMTNPGTSGTSVTFLSSPSNFAIDFNSPNTLDPSSTGGFAFVEGVNGAGFSQLTIAPETVTFSSFKFNLMLPAPEGPNGANFTNKTNFTFNLTVDYNGGSSQLFSGVTAGANGENRMLISTTAGEAINEIIFSNLQGVTGNAAAVPYNFDSLRQMSFNAVGGAVPEPATWALFILGFGLTGGMLRNARKRGALQTA